MQYEVRLKDGTSVTFKGKYRLGDDIIYFDDGFVNLSDIIFVKASLQ